MLATIVRWFICWDNKFILILNPCPVFLNLSFKSVWECSKLYKLYILYNIRQSILYFLSSLILGSALKILKPNLFLVGFSWGSKRRMSSMANFSQRFQHLKFNTSHIPFATANSRFSYYIWIQIFQTFWGIFCWTGRELNHILQMKYLGVNRIRTDYYNSNGKHLCGF